MAHHNASSAHGLGYLDGRTLTPFTTVALKIVVAIAKWEANRRSRNHLKQLSDHLLDDIGVTRDMAAKEVVRPFWRG
ncbi:DUF1127 domain-containing protein [Marinovum sp. 2_MG-2023]|uniref:DUF1127 domain-containing protein n=1 Tax=Roseobacteraceae TaxID=2854170 RepID=UPI001FD30F2B|nr:MULTISPECIES: DUF1127 domain-containing protein [Roseobacteraceae]MCJ7872230.1 DUF1127 domain-containing protein [Phaeobacter sp. J2-8]MDO6729505.1 DUF1127 domain-containing protein [Marinovum sp. 2_MG-2023]MDO6780341.1 DUF1127 domain-containing protein [Marinovum sp. 1_MG-2023]